MNKITAFTLSGVLLFGAVACNNNDVAKTDEAAPDSVSGPVKTPEAEEVKEARKDGENQTRQAQLESDIRAREQRNNMGINGQQVRDDDNLASEVRDKLEANIPGGLLTVKAKDGIVTHLPHPEVSHYEFWLFGDFGFAIAKRIFQFFV
jgi:hypothetical protein